jgi:hypothetical protein
MRWEFGMIEFGEVLREEREREDGHCWGCRRLGAVSEVRGSVVRGWIGWRQREFCACGLLEQKELALVGLWGIQLFLIELIGGEVAEEKESGCVVVVVVVVAEVFVARQKWYLRENVLLGIGSFVEVEDSFILLSGWRLFVN